MKRLLFLILTVVALMAIVFPATAVTTTEEKSRQYQAAIRELEAYLESYGNEGNLYGIQSVFESLGKFEQSKSLYYYTTVLIKLSEETYDFELLSTLELLDLDQRFQDYLNDALRGSPLCSVEELKTYAEGREKENNADPEAAMECYKNCMSYFDASERYKELRGNKYQHIYDQALEMLNAGDLAGAYFLFSEIAPFEQSEDRKTVIVKLLGYTPESPTDNLLPVTEAVVTSVQQTEVVLSWSASKHAKTYEVQYKQGGTDSWTSLGETESTTYTVSGLAANTTYDFRIIAAIDKIKAEGKIISVDTAIEIKPDLGPNTEVEEEDNNSQDLILPLAVDTFESHTYAVFEDAEYTWTQAEDYCNQLGGHLVTIKSAGEQSHIESLISRGTKGLYWIGGKKDEAGDFRWIDDNSLVGKDNKYWDAGQPDNDNSGRKEDYMQILRVFNPDAAKMADGTSYSHKNRWNNNVNDNDYGTEFFSIHNVGFVCEWDNTINLDDLLHGRSLQVIKDGDYKIACYADDKYYLNIGGYRSPARDGRNVQIGYTEDGRIIAADAWTIEYDYNDGYYRIKQFKQNVSLSVRDNSGSDGANVQAWTCNSDSGQKWEICQNNDGSYRIKAVCSGLSLDIDGETIEQTSNVQQWSDKDSNAQKWVFIPFDEDTYYVKDVQSIVYLRVNPNASEAIISEVPKGATVLSSGVIYEGFMCVVYNDVVGYIDYRCLETR